MIGGASFGKRFQHSSFENFNADKNTQLAIDACRNVIEGIKEGVILTGPVGVGKTHLLIATAKAFNKTANGEMKDGVFQETQESRNVQYWPILDLIERMKEEIDKGEALVLQRCLNCDLFILDDVGAERSTGWIMEKLTYVFDWRYRNQLSIAIGTNLSIKELLDKYSDRIISRWAETCKVVPMKGDDYRLKGTS